MIHGTGDAAQRTLLRERRRVAGAVAFAPAVKCPGNAVSGAAEEGQAAQPSLLTPWQKPWTDDGIAPDCAGEKLATLFTFAPS